MTEFDLALDFLQACVRAAGAATESGLPLDDRDFRRHCNDIGVEVTAQRLELVHDLAEAINECIRRGEDQEASEDSEFATRVIPTSCLSDGLERYGWRVAWLTKDVSD